ncbi:CsbD family protein [Adhaeretor mobilis]|uniref:CsbD-like domain-containing protein n=1 Tax=Adhaeretor mobilis TaxID=1930276 RepID=A0A517N278_9BACT|nr:CsbD family protein [Adhaeretor mobilis]QDT01108.1 hypothetical protein HG15A2_44500 [Adhaeretor mobilis]
MITQQQLTGNWNQLKGLIQEKWGQLTDDELQEVSGEFEQIVGLIQQKTGEARQQVEATLEKLSEKSSGMVQHAADTAKEYFGQASDSMRDAAGQVRQTVEKRPAESVAVAFGTGLLAGVVVGLVLRSR